MKDPAPAVTSPSRKPEVHRLYAYAECCQRGGEIVQYSQYDYYCIGTDEQSADVFLAYEGTEDEIVAAARATISRQNCGMHSFRVAGAALDLFDRPTLAIEEWFTREPRAMLREHFDIVSMDRSWAAGDFGHLFDAETDEYMRPATRDEAIASYDDLAPRGIVCVNDRDCYVLPTREGGAA